MGRRLFDVTKKKKTGDAKGEARALIDASFASYWSQNGLASFVPPFLLHLEMIRQRCRPFACCRLQHSMLWDGKKQVD